MVVDIEAVLNDRPLTYLSNDCQDPAPFTPSHLLYGRRITRVPHELVSDVHDIEYESKSTFYNTSDIDGSKSILPHCVNFTNIQGTMYRRSMLVMLSWCMMRDRRYNGGLQL